MILFGAAAGASASASSTGSSAARRVASSPSPRALHHDCQLHYAQAPWHRRRARLPEVSSRPPFVGL